MLFEDKLVLSLMTAILVVKSKIRRTEAVSRFSCRSGLFFARKRTRSAVVDCFHDNEHVIPVVSDSLTVLFRIEMLLILFSF